MEVLDVLKKASPRAMTVPEIAHHVNYSDAAIYSQLEKLHDRCQVLCEEERVSAMGITLNRKLWRYNHYLLDSDKKKS